MTESLAVIVFLATLFLLLGLGVWVGAALLMTAVVGMTLFTDTQIGYTMAVIVWSDQSSWTLTALPLFIWMGEILFRSRLSESLFKGLAPFMQNLPGGLLHVNIGASAVFAAISGSSAATVATVGKMAIPELTARKYPDKMILGTLSGAGTLGLLIPPSIAMIIYGVTINESIAKLFIASIIPGICLALCFMAYVMFWSLRNPESMPKREKSTANKLQALKHLLPVLTLIVAVISSIYSGIATATEAAAIGTLGALVLSATQRSLNLDTFTQGLLGAIRTSAMIMFILMGASFISTAMGFTGIPKSLAETIVAWELSPFALILILTVFYIILGCFLDGISSIVLTMAVLEPMLRSYGIDMIWFGVYLMIVVEMAQITPPIGFNLFVLQGMTGKDMGEIARASLPMFFVMLMFVFVLILWPSLATWLPSIMK